MCLLRSDRSRRTAVGVRLPVAVAPVAASPTPIATAASTFALAIVAGNSVTLRDRRHGWVDGPRLLRSPLLA
jgi:acyl-CoA reductase-like NAD-dependent aldehyde dehydrogenase